MLFLHSYVVDSWLHTSACGAICVVSGFSSFPHRSAKRGGRTHPESTPAHWERCVWLLLHGDISLSLPSETGNTFSRFRHINHNLCTSNFSFFNFFCSFTTYAYLFPCSKRNSNLMGRKSYLIYSRLYKQHVFLHIQVNGIMKTRLCE